MDEGHKNHKRQGDSGISAISLAMYALVFD